MSDESEDSIQDNDDDDETYEPSPVKRKVQHKSKRVVDKSIENDASCIYRPTACGSALINSLNTMVADGDIDNSIAGLLLVSFVNFRTCLS